jgi:hypothetical protein
MDGVSPDFCRVWPGNVCLLDEKRRKKNNVNLNLDCLEYEIEAL